MLLDLLKFRLAMRRRRDGYHSRFGGLWPDMLDARAQLDARRRAGTLSQEHADLLHAWMRDGYVILPGAVELSVVDAVREELDRAWATRDPRHRVETGVGGESHPLDPQRRGGGAKLLDAYVHCAPARAAAFAPPITSFLRTLFERDLLLFQSLSFEYGSRQPLHQDTAYVVVDSPMEFAACWIALEDIRPGSGELNYYRGSHRIEEHLFRGGYRSWSRKRDGLQAHEQYLAGLHERSRAAGCELQAFLPRKGDALIWNADLVHGGGVVSDEALTRHSLVCHYCPADVRPFYVAYKRDRHKSVEHSSGCRYSSMHFPLHGAGSR